MSATQSIGLSGTGINSAVSRINEYGRVGLNVDLYIFAVMFLMYVFCYMSKVDKGCVLSLCKRVVLV